MNIADIIAIVIVVLLAVWGAKKGFVRTAFSVVSLVLSLVLALTLYPVVTEFIAESPVGEAVYSNVYKIFDGEEAEPQTAEEAGSKLNLPQTIQKSISDTADKAVSTVKESVAQSTAALALKLLSILIVFVLVRVILWLLQKVLNLVTKLPVIHTANKLLGGVAGAVYGVLLIYLILALLTFTTTVKTFNKPTELILDSKIVSTMYHQNIVLGFLD